MPGLGPSVREWTVVPLVGDDGDVDRILAMSIDVTQQRRMLAELREADQRKSEFIAMLSHELRNPLAAIKLGLHVLEHGAPGSEAAAASRTIIDRQVEQLVRLVDDLLDVTRITQNKIQLQRQRLDLNELVRATIEDNRPHLERGGVRVDGEAGERADLRQRGRRAHRAGADEPARERGEVHAGAAGRRPCRSRRIRRARRCCASTDNGVGHRAALLPRLFEPFMQADRTLARSGGGLGLGLALVKGLVELHGGR